MLTPHSPDFTIYIGNPRPIDVSQHEPTDEIDTMLRVMEVRTIGLPIAASIAYQP